VEVTAIGDLLAAADQKNAPGRFSAEAVLSAIEAAIELTAGTERPHTQIKLHADTGLLISAGSPREIGTIQQLIQELRKNASEKLPQQLAERNRIIEMLRQETDQLREENRRLAELLKSKPQEPAAQATETTTKTSE
jgi:hypothetical protein